MNYKYLLFDLDGTITDPKEGITKSVQYALKKENIHEPDLDKLDCFIGPPLHDSFEAYYGFSGQDADRLIENFREYFSERGLFENIPYEGIENILKTLKSKGYILAIATSKPTFFANKILDHFNLSHYFTAISGSCLDGTRVAKAEVITHVLKSLNNPPKKEVVMIGDRKHDLKGAAQVGLDAVGVLYGYGSLDELSKETAISLVSTPEELLKYFI
jgi:phosphoglycolate phosphatase